MYKKGNFSKSYTEVPNRNPGRAWCNGMVSGNGINGYIESGSPYFDTFIFQNVNFIYPSPEPRRIPNCLKGQFSEARKNVFEMNDEWVVENGFGEPYKMTFYYSFHPGHQLRLTVLNSTEIMDYLRYTDYETAETGVKYTDEYGEWRRTSFTSREDNVSITKIQKSSLGEKINMIISIDEISGMHNAYDERFKVRQQKYKMFVNEDADYIARISHYPSHRGSELADGGYAGVTRLIVNGGTKERIFFEDTDGEMNVGELGNPAIRITNADEVYLITECDKTDDMGKYEDFDAMSEYELLNRLLERTKHVQDKYTKGKHFDYDAALAPSAKKHSKLFNAVAFEPNGDEEFKNVDSDMLIEIQKNTKNRINHEFLKRVYEQGRYALICCAGVSAPKLYGMWIGEWNPPWCAIYTLDANVNLQVSAMNTGNISDMAVGYISFFLRNVPDFMRNAEAAYDMHDAIQTSVNSDGNRAMHIQYNNSYPFQYWNAGASWCLLPIYEYWQCFGDTRIPINEYMNIDELQEVLSPRDGGLTAEEFDEIKQRGYLELEKDILLPLLTKQANFWEQICTPEYYISKDGKASYLKGKQELCAGERYMIIPSYSPENRPKGYNSTITANATMDISAARDGLKMAIELEKSVKRSGYEQAVKKWEMLLERLPEYKIDADGALCEWAMSEYSENNNHRHISHLYCAWPGYEAQHDAELAKACTVAIENRNKYNSTDATAGHGWVHKALVLARLKQGDETVKALLPMTNSDAFYGSLMTDHDSNRRMNAYCTDTVFGINGVVNEMLVYSDSEEIELLPALPTDLQSGSIKGVAARCRIIVDELKWNIRTVTARLTASENVSIRLKCGVKWKSAEIDGVMYPAEECIALNLTRGEVICVDFKL